MAEGHVRRSVQEWHQGLTIPGDLWGVLSACQPSEMIQFNHSTSPDLNNLRSKKNKIQKTNINGEVVLFVNFVLFSKKRSLSLLFISLPVFSCSGLLVRFPCQLRFKHLLWKQRSVVWKSPAEAFKGCGSQAKSNIWVWSDWEVHKRNLFIPTHQMRISSAVRKHFRVLGKESWQVTGWDPWCERSWWVITVGSVRLGCSLLLQWHEQQNFKLLMRYSFSAYLCCANIKLTSNISVSFLLPSWKTFITPSAAVKSWRQSLVRSRELEWVQFISVYLYSTIQNKCHPVTFYRESRQFKVWFN